MAADHELNDLIRAIVEAETGQAVQRVEPVDGTGEVNEARFVATRDAALVVRVGRWLGDVRTYYKEEWCMQATADLIPGARVVSVGVHDSRPYMIQTRIAGVVATRSAMSAEEIWTQLGRYARRLDEVVVQGYGNALTARGSGVFADTWADNVDWYCDYLFDDDLLVRVGALAPDDRDAFREKLAALRELALGPRLNHGNFAEKNTIVGDDGVLSVIDWGTAESSPGLYLDVAELVTWGDAVTLQAFLNGCEIGGSEWRRMQPIVDAFVIRRCMSGVRWVHDIGHPKLHEHAEFTRAHADRIRSGEPPFGIP